MAGRDGSSGACDVCGEALREAYSFDINYRNHRTRNASFAQQTYTPAEGSVHQHQASLVVFEQ